MVPLRANDQRKEEVGDSRAVKHTRAKKDDEVMKRFSKRMKKVKKD